MKLLIVEDEPSLLELMCRSLEKERYVVETASDYFSARQKIEEYDYDCILLDIMLPDGNGLDLLRLLKQMGKKENVINILYYFSNRVGYLVNKTLLAEAVWGDHIDQVDNFDFIYAQIKNLRKKLREAGAMLELKAVYGIGYKLQIEE